MTSESVLESASKRVETLLDRFSVFPPSTGARTDAEELVRIVSSLYGHALARIIESAQEQLGEQGAAFIERCCADPVVSSLLITHGLHPVPLEERVRAALLHFDNAQIVSLSEDVAEIRVDGPEDLVPLIEQAVHRAAPEILDVRCVGQTISLLSVR